MKENEGVDDEEDEKEKGEEKEKENEELDSAEEGNEDLPAQVNVLSFIFLLPVSNDSFSIQSRKVLLFLSLLKLLVL